MRTTLRLDSMLYRQAKATAAREGITLTRFIEEALRLRLRTPPKAPSGHTVRLPTFDGGTGAFALSPSELKTLIRETERQYDLCTLSGTPKSPPRGLKSR